MGQPPKHRHPAWWESEGLTRWCRVLRMGKLIVRIMFSQVLICVWREVLEFIIHPTGGGHGPGRLPALEPASWLYWHVPFVMNAAEVHLRNSLVRQPSWQQNAELRHSASSQQQERSRSVLGGQEGTNWNCGRKASFFLSVLFFFFFFLPPFISPKYRAPLGKSPALTGRVPARCFSAAG